MTAIDPDHRVLMQEARRWYIHHLGDLVFGLTKAEIMEEFRPLISKSSERAATDLINKAYSKQPLRLAHAKYLLEAIKRVMDKQQREHQISESQLIAAYFMIDGFDRMLKDLALDPVRFPKENGITTELIQDLMEGARTTLFTALLVLRIVNRLRHKKKLGWIDPRKCILTDVRRGKEKLKVAAAMGTLVEQAPYPEWMPHKGSPVDLRPEDRALKGQKADSDAPDDGDDDGDPNVVPLHTV